MSSPSVRGRASAGDLTRRRRAREWLLLTGNRMAVSAVLLLVVAFVVLIAVVSGFTPLRVRDPMLFMLFALISGNFTLITIVVSLNQFVLTRHLESPDEIRHRMDEMLGYRQEVSESSMQTVLPITPSGFLKVLFSNIARHGRDLERRIPEIENEQTRTALDQLTAELDSHASYVIDLLEDAPRSVQPALFTTLNANYASSIYLAFYLESEYAGAISEETTTLLTQLIRSLKQVDVARRFFKTVFIQSELASLSRLLLYIGLPVQVVTVVLLLAFSAPATVGPSRTVVMLIIPVIVILGFAPFVILTSFIVRLSTVAKRTAAMYPFTEEPSTIASVFETPDRAERSVSDEAIHAGRGRED